ncbi:hypothetical protein H696_04320 [Fonticula alba]|uniref:Nicastrin n=1 Tax=Fonticula alba TaxID=691883 RepID=A0A058Z441_FONAL|nr:hypothetical protein H696_04320 [Fonticula alba]KCV68901.1 hypothetical protein H696_04320 [Fonticula alba]|eukprot:XP_009496472.1 hypothetical protein H696_04320 [Fonticula alba]
MAHDLLADFMAVKKYGACQTHGDCASTQRCVGQTCMEITSAYHAAYGTGLAESGPGGTFEVLPRDRLPQGVGGTYTESHWDYTSGQVFLKSRTSAREVGELFGGIAIGALSVVLLGLAFNLLSRKLKTESDITAALGVLGAAHAFGEYVRSAGIDTKTFEKDVLFALFDAEAFALAGSSRFAQEIVNFKCDKYPKGTDTTTAEWCESPYRQSLAFRKLSINSLAAHLHLTQLGTASPFPGDPAAGDPADQLPALAQLFAHVHNADIGSDAVKLVELLRKLAVLLPGPADSSSPSASSSLSSSSSSFSEADSSLSTGSVSTSGSGSGSGSAPASASASSSAPAGPGDLPLAVVPAWVPVQRHQPPASTHPFLMYQDTIASVVLSDFHEHYQQTNYHSQLDTAASLANKNAVLRMICDTSTLIARAAFSLATGAADPAAVPAAIQANCTMVNELFDCMTTNISCPLLAKYFTVASDNTRLNYYAGVYRPGFVSSQRFRFHASPSRRPAFHVPWCIVASSADLWCPPPPPHPRLDAQGTGLNFRSSPVPIASLRPHGTDEDEDSLRAILHGARSNAGLNFKGDRLHAIEMRSFMHATGSSGQCLRRKQCDPLGGHSAWAASRPLGPGASKPQSFVLISAALDTNAFFQDQAFGVGSDITAALGVLGAAHAFGEYVRSAGIDTKTFEKDVLFALFDAEAFALAGRPGRHAVRPAILLLAKTLLLALLLAGPAPALGDLIRATGSGAGAPPTKATRDIQKNLHSEIYQETLLDPCVRLLSAEGTFGCHAPSNRNGVLYEANSVADVDLLLQDQDLERAGPFVPILPVSLFSDLAIFERLVSSPRVAGILPSATACAHMQIDRRDSRVTVLQAMSMSDLSGPTSASALADINSRLAKLGFVHDHLPGKPATLPRAASTTDYVPPCHNVGFCKNHQHYFLKDAELGLLCLTLPRETCTLEPADMCAIIRTAGGRSVLPIRADLYKAEKSKSSGSKFRISNYEALINTMLSEFIRHHRLGAVWQEPLARRADSNFRAVRVPLGRLCALFSRLDREYLHRGVSSFDVFLDADSPSVTGHYMTLLNPELQLSPAALVSKKNLLQDHAGSQKKKLPDEEDLQRLAHLQPAEALKALELKLGRQNIQVVCQNVAELLSSERSFLRRVTYAIEHSLPRLETFARGHPDLISTHDVQFIFSGLHRVVQLNRRFLQTFEVATRAFFEEHGAREILQMLFSPEEVARSPVQPVADPASGPAAPTVLSCLSWLAHRLEEYKPYISSIVTSLERLTKRTESSPQLADFLGGLASTEDRLQLKDLLMEPVQRLTRYDMLVSNILQHWDLDSVDFRQLLAIYVQVLRAGRMIDTSTFETKAMTETINIQRRVLDCPPTLISSTRLLLGKVAVNVLDPSDNTHTKCRGMLFLFSDAVMMAFQRSVIAQSSFRMERLCDLKDFSFDLLQSTPGGPVDLVVANFSPNSAGSFLGAMVGQELLDSPAVVSASASSASLVAGSTDSLNTFGGVPMSPGGGEDMYGGGGGGGGSDTASITSINSTFASTGGAAALPPHMAPLSGGGMTSLRRSNSISSVSSQASISSVATVMTMFSSGGSSRSTGVRSSGAEDTFVLQMVGEAHEVDIFVRLLRAMHPYASRTATTHSRLCDDRVARYHVHRLSEVDNFLLDTRSQSLSAMVILSADSDLDTCFKEDLLKEYFSLAVVVIDAQRDTVSYGIRSRIEHALAGDDLTMIRVHCMPTFSEAKRTSAKGAASLPDYAGQPAYDINTFGSSLSRKMLSCQSAIGQSFCSFDLDMTGTYGLMLHNIFSPLFDYASKPRNRLLRSRGRFNTTCFTVLPSTVQGSPLRLFHGQQAHMRVNGLLAGPPPVGTAPASPRPTRSGSTSSSLFRRNSTDCPSTPGGTDDSGRKQFGPAAGHGTDFFASGGPEDPSGIPPTASVTVATTPVSRSLSTSRATPHSSKSRFTGYLDDAAESEIAPPMSIAPGTTPRPAMRIQRLPTPGGGAGGGGGGGPAGVPGSDLGMNPLLPGIRPPPGLTPHRPNRLSQNPPGIPSSLSHVSTVGGTPGSGVAPALPLPGRAPLPPAGAEPGVGEVPPAGAAVAPAPVPVPVVHTAVSASTTTTTTPAMSATGGEQPTDAGIPRKHAGPTGSSPFSEDMMLAPASATSLTSEAEDALSPGEAPATPVRSPSSLPTASGAAGAAESPLPGLADLSLA